MSAKDSRGQGVPNRKRILEAQYGKAASREVRKHLAISRQLKKAVATLNAYEQFTAKEMPGFTNSRLEAQRKEVSRREGLLLASFLKVSTQPETLRNLANVAERDHDRDRDENGPAFQADLVLLTFWGAGQRSYKRLYRMVLLMDSQCSPQRFSKIVAHYEKRGRISGIRRGKDDPKELSLRERKKRLKQAEDDTLEALGKLSMAQHAAHVERQWRKHKTEREKP